MTEPCSLFLILGTKMVRNFCFITNSGEKRQTFTDIDKIVKFFKETYDQSIPLP